MKTAVLVTCFCTLFLLAGTASAERGWFDYAGLVPHYGQHQIGSGGIGSLFIEHKVILRLETHQTPPKADMVEYVKDLWDRLGMDTKGKPEYNILAVYVNSTNELILGRSNECALPADVLTRIAENVSALIDAGKLKMAFDQLVILLSDEIRDRVDKPIECPLEGEDRVKDLLGKLESPDLDTVLVAIYELGEMGSAASSAVPALTKLLEDPEWRKRGGAAASLGDIGSETAIPALTKLLGDEEGLVRASAAKALARIGEPAIPTLIEVIKKNENEHARYAALESLGKMGPAASSAVQTLIEMLEDESRSDFWIHSIRLVEALGNIGSDQAIPALTKVLLEDFSDGDRMEAAKALGNIGSEQAIPALIKALGDEWLPVRHSAAHALGDIGPSEDPTIFSQEISALTKLLEHERDSMKHSLAEILGDMGSEQAIPALAKTLLNASLSSNTRRAAAVAIGEIGSPSPQAVSALIKALEDDEWVREAAVYSLLVIGAEVPSSTVPVLVGLLEDDWRTRRDAILVLGEMGPAAGPAVPALTEALGDRNNVVKAAAAYALGGIGPAAAPAVPELGRMLKNKSFENLDFLGLGSVHGIVVNALGNIGSNEAVSVLIEVLRDSGKGPIIKAAAIKSLGLIGSSAGEQAVTALIPFLKDSFLRKSAAIALGGIGPAAAPAVPGIIPMLEDPISLDSQIALEAITKIGEPAVPHLITALKDGNEKIREQAAHALTLIGEPAIPALKEAMKDPSLKDIVPGIMTDIGESSIPSLVLALKDPDEDARLAAAKALGSMGPKAKPAVPALVQALEDGSAGVRKQAALSLSYIRAKEAVPALVKTSAKDSDSAVREAASTSLERIGPATVSEVPALIVLLKESDLDTSLAATGALVKVGEPAVPSLVELLKDSVADVRIAAIETLAEIGSDTAKEALQKAATEDPDRDVREAAEEALNRMRKRVPMTVPAYPQFVWLVVFAGAVATAALVML
jgi:HEAT repeat protein